MFSGTDNLVFILLSLGSYSGVILMMLKLKPIIVKKPRK